MTRDRIMGEKSESGGGRRTFLKSTAGFVLGAVIPRSRVWAETAARLVRPAGPASQYKPRIHAAFVRRKESYGMWWPGEVYDGEKARVQYTAQITQTAKSLQAEAVIRPEPIFTGEEADAWLKQAQAEKADGLLVVLLDRQKHAWPTAQKAAACPIPAVIFAPIGAAFTLNTAQPAHQSGVMICSALDFDQAAWGMKALAAGTKLRETRYAVIKGDSRSDTEVKHFGTKLRNVPGQVFLNAYRDVPENDELNSVVEELIAEALEMRGPTRAEVVNGVKSLFACRTILEQEEADGITMDCLGILADAKISLPCISWSTMLDCAIPAACEADIGAALTHALVQYCFDRPGFQQDPVPETARQCLIGAHCTCPTKLSGFDGPAASYSLVHHHGMRDATRHTAWKVGERVSVACIQPSDSDEVPPTMIISTGAVVDNVAVPPAGGCVVSVMIQLDGEVDYLTYPGMHQIFFYGDFKRQLKDYCRLYGITVKVV